VIRDRELLSPRETLIAALWSVTIVSGKFAADFGVFVPPRTARMMPLVLGITTVVVHDTDPVHVKRMVSPSLAEEIAPLTVAAEQSLGPRAIVVAPA